LVDLTKDTQKLNKPPAEDASLQRKRQRLEQLDIRPAITVYRETPEE
jgi:hypothetical protein